MGAVVAEDLMPGLPVTEPDAGVRGRGGDGGEADEDEDGDKDDEHDELEVTKEAAHAASRLTCGGGGAARAKDAGIVYRNGNDVGALSREVFWPTPLPAPPAAADAIWRGRAARSWYPLKCIEGPDESRRTPPASGDMWKTMSSGE